MGLGHDLIYAAATAAASPWWGYRMLRTGKWRTDWAGRLGRCPRLDDDGRPTLLLHAVSVGEVNAVAGLVRHLDEQTQGRWRLVVSATTDTGFARAQQLFGGSRAVVRFPLDFSRCVRRFLGRVRPDLVALVELEVWPNLVQQCERQGTPVCVINGRLSDRSFARYRAVAMLVRPTFARLAAVAAQSPEYAQRFVALGVRAERVRVIDSMKWDTAQVVEASSVAGAEALAQEMGIDRHRPVVVAGSTGPGEEKMLMAACPADVQLVLVPRRPERFDQVAALDPAMVRRSRAGRDGMDGGSGADTKQAPRFFLIDTMGELRKAYALADVAIVGRSFLGLYGSNPLEPLALGRPTIIGPHHDDFTQIVAALVAGRGIVVSDRPMQAAAGLLADREAAGALARRGCETIAAHQGATDRHVQMLIHMMPGSAPRDPVASPGRAGERGVVQDGSSRHGDASVG